MPEPESRRPLAWMSLGLGFAGVAFLVADGMEAGWATFPLWPSFAVVAGMAGFFLGIVAQRGAPAVIGMIVSGLTCLLVLAMAGGRSARWERAQSDARSDVRNMLSAQAAYAGINGGYFEGEPACLARDGGCIPGETDWTGAQLGTWRRSPKRGYEREMHPGEAPGPDQIRSAGASPSSVVSYAYYIRPTVPAGNGFLPQRGFTGILAFCGDSEGTMCAWRPEPTSPAPIKNGRCLVIPDKGHDDGFHACQPASSLPQ